MRLFLLKILSVIGLSGGMGSGLLRVFTRFRSILVSVFVLTLFIPLFELGFIGSLYVLLSPEKQMQVLVWFSDHGVCNWQPLLCEPALTVRWASGFAGVLLLVFVAAKLLYSYCLAKLNYGTYVMYTNRLLADYINMPPMRFLSFDRSKMVNCIVLEVARFGNVATDLLSLGTTIVTALFFFAGAAMMSLPLLGVSFSVGVSMLLINRYGYRKARRIGSRRVSAVNKMLARTYDILEGFRTIKLEGAEARIVKKSDRRIRKEQRWRFDNKWNMLSVNNLAQGFTYLVLFVIILVAVVVMRMDVAVMLTFMVIMGRLQKVFLTGQTHWMKIKQNIASLEIVAEMLEQCERAQEPSPLALTQDTNGDTVSVRFDKVGFRYAKESEWTHRNVSLRLDPGDRILIQGRSGQGKSTLLYLLLGLLEPSEGRILYNEEPLTLNVFEKYRNKIAYAAPDLHLFRESIRQNLALAGEFDDEALLRAVKQARLDSVLSGLPDGLDGFIGENGANLSLGERQRVMLARIFLKKPKLLVLDEATSNLDVGLEDEILKDLISGLDEDAILVLIAHKKPANVRFNRVLILERGELKEHSNGKRKVDEGEAALTNEYL